MDKLEKIRDEGLSLPRERADRCCWCLKIQIGVIIIGILMVMSAVN